MNEKVFVIECTGELEFSVELKMQFKDNETFPDVFPRYYDEFFDSDDLCYAKEDAIQNAIWKFSPPEGRELDCDAYNEGFYPSAHNYLEELRKKIQLSAYELNSDETLNEVFHISSDFFIEALHDLFTEREECEYYYIDIGRALYSEVESVLDPYWCFGLQSDKDFLMDIEFWPEPLVIDGKIKCIKDGEELIPLMNMCCWDGDLPDPKYSFSTQDHSMIKNFLLNNDEYEVICYIVENYDGEMSWVYDCGYDMLTTEYLREECPVNIAEDDDDDTINEKINTFFCDQYRKYHQAESAEADAKK